MTFIFNVLLIISALLFCSHLMLAQKYCQENNSKTDFCLNKNPIDNTSSQNSTPCQLVISPEIAWLLLHKIKKNGNCILKRLNAYHIMKHIFFRPMRHFKDVKIASFLDLMEACILF
ncbi:hypothetical protein EDEG_02286 [Edhazardia aedis USNM 41457]|uniref:Uncharacterized protein n=1 Tax=Edhazardia aedis (strain USNM 41457) TaxID=1003232 RepID=J9D6E6_EDHAE|nr:hypothetical protein EDEG_02286 [Edhazardia aedis USNM 41457]|eukprot:EJW03376.1 hypothetical protein EDEG_02286 [Edhazardia aedis USNM 41457]